MKQVYLLLCLQLIAFSVLGQDSTIALRQAPRAILKFAPLSLFDQDATVQAGVEYRISRLKSVQAEFGYGWKGLSVFTSDLDDFVKAEVWRFRAESRFYTSRYRTNRRRELSVRSNFPLGNYWAIEGLGKQINITRRNYEYQSVYSSSAPRYIGLANISRYVLGSHVKIGRQFAFYDPLNRRFSRTLLDIYFGAGVRWVMNGSRQSGLGTPDECGCGVGRSFNKDGSQWAPSLTAGLKIGFAL